MKLKTLGCFIQRPTIVQSIAARPGSRAFMNAGGVVVDFYGFVATSPDRTG